MEKLITLKRVSLGVILLLVLAIVGGLLFAGKPMDLHASDQWLDYIENADFIVEELEVESEDYKLEAELFIPIGGETKKPVVVFSGGSGDGIYQDYTGDFHHQVIIDYYHSHDISVVLYNKRGLGESEGNWYKNDFEGRAADVGAIIDVIKTYEVVDVNHIGVIGHSQGGWIAPLVASQRDDIAFWVAYAGPATSYTEQVEDLHETYYRCNGKDEEQVKRDVKLKLFIVETAAKIGKVLPIGIIGFDANAIDYDPADILKNLEVPGIMFFGENDPLVDVTRNEAAIDRIFGTTSPEFLEYHTIPSADHSFRVVNDMCVDYEESLNEPYANELFEQLDEWLEQLGY